MAGRRDPDRSALSLFADELRAARDHAGLSREELGERLNYSGSLVGMVESLKRVPQADFAARCDEVFGTIGTFARLQRRLRTLPFTASFRPFAAYEEVAISLRTFEHALVPGLLQTPEYARAVLGTRPNTTTDELDDMVAARLAGRRSWTGITRRCCGWSLMRRSCIVRWATARSCGSRWSTWPTWRAGRTSLCR